MTGQTASSPRLHFWIREESKPGERRTPLMPSEAKRLLEAGHEVTVESSSVRCVPDDAFSSVGCRLVPSGSWRSAPTSALILGLKNLPEEGTFPLIHQHVYFAHAYKKQPGWRELLNRFMRGGGRVLDMEYLTDDNGRRIAAFGRPAGYVGMAIGILAWCHQQLSDNPDSTLPTLDYHEDYSSLFTYVQTQLERAVAKTGRRPRAAVIGAHGRCGNGAAHFASQAGVEIEKWDITHTNVGGPFPSLLNVDIVINAIYLLQPIAPFITKELLEENRDLPSRLLSVIVDISCDPSNPYNPLPIYSEPTTIFEPVSRVLSGPKPVDLIAIDHFPTVVPLQSSSDFSAAIIDHLLHTSNSAMWARCRQVFKDKVAVLLESEPQAEVQQTQPPTLQLPTDYQKPDSTSNNGSLPFELATRTLPAELVNSLRNLSENYQSDLASLLNVTWQVILHRLTGEEDLAIGFIKATSDTQGTFLKTRLDISGNPFFTEFFSEFSHFVKKHNKSQNYENLTSLVEQLQSEAKNVQTLFGSLPSTSQDQLTTFLKSAGAFYDMSLFAVTSANGVDLNLSYRSDLFSVERVTELLNEISFFLEQVASHPHVGIQTVSLVTAESSKNLPNPTEPLDATWFGSVQHHFHLNALKHPNKIAAVHKNDSLTYQQLDHWTSKLANHLVAQGLKPEEAVFIYGHRNLAMVVAVIGILKAGGAVSLMDPQYPSERIINCLKVAEPHGWITIEAAGQAPQEVLDFLPNVGCTIQVVLPLPKDAEARNFLAESSGEDPQVPVTKDHTAVITFTSGSTGLPKGVLGRHGPLTHFYPWIKERFQLNENDRISMCSGISHDPLQRDIFTPLWLGAEIHIPDAEDIGNPGQLAEWMKSHQISVTHLTPAMGQLLSETIRDVQVTSLKLALLVGGKLTKRDVHRLCKVAPNVTCVNMYGSTETQRSVSYYVVPSNEELIRMKEILPSGVGMKDVQIIILNNHQLRVGVGEVGEIYMRSSHLAKGYKGLEDQTRAKFLQNFFRPGDVEDRFYRTGDLGRYRPDGNSEVVGRIDNQVKIRGFRIELGEINTVLSFHPAIKENVPTVREISPGEKRIVAYVIPHSIEEEQHPTGLQLRQFLEGKLPHYMVPSAFVFLKALPLTPNGKINFDALPAPEGMFTDKTDLEYADAAAEKTRNAFATADERRIAGLFQKVLSISTFNPDDTFFELGGHSLLATRFVFLLNQEFSQEFPLDVLLKNPTVTSLAAALEAYRSNQISSRPPGRNWADECVLDSSIVVSPSLSSSPSSFSTQGDLNVFLTGVTGFLGVFVLRELLEQTNATVHCLVRASTKIDGKQRVQQTLKLHRIWKDEYENRIIPVPGDLAKPLLGMPQETFDVLAETVDYIIHSGAYVHWIFPYEQLKPANVNGTEEILRLASTTKLKPVHHVSTTSVFDADFYYRENSSHPVLEEDALEHHQGLSGGYPQSKWVAEKLVMEARKLGIPANIYRPGYISGDGVNGIWTTDDFLCRVIKGCITLGAFPNLPNHFLDICSVDYVSKAIVKTAQTSTSYGKSFHLTNDHLFEFNTFFENAHRFGFQVEKIPFTEWRSRLIESQNKGENNALHPVISVFSPSYETKKQNPPYSRKNIAEVLQGTDVVCNHVEENMPLYFSYFVRSGFLNEPANVNTPFYKEWIAAKQEETMDLVTRTNRSQAQTV